MSNLTGLMRVLLVSLAIPAIGFLISTSIIHDINKDLAANEWPNASIVCDYLKAGKLSKEMTSDLSGFCTQVALIKLLGYGSIVAAFIGALIPVMYWLASLYAGTNRKKMATIFPLALRHSLWLITLSILLQGVILTYAVYVGESYATGRVHIYIIGAIGIGALLGAIGLTSASARMSKKLEMTVFGKLLYPTDAPQLFAFVHSLADKLGAKTPDNIIVGLEPTFYVTSINIKMPSNEADINGETLFVSAPLSRLMTQQELAAIIGHELGHFRGEDTEYSMKFAPVYAGLGEALGAIGSGSNEGASGLAKLPAIYLLTYMYKLFATNEAKISRDREHKADLAGAETSTPLALSTALIKVSLYADLWAEAQQKNIYRLEAGKVATNLSVIFQDAAKYDVEHESLSDIMQSTLEQTIPHPTDSHPPVSQRIKALDVKVEEISKEMLLIPRDSAIEIIDNFQSIEEEITVLEHNFMFDSGLALPPDEALEKNTLLHATYSLAASMVCADGKIDHNEIAVAERIGEKLFYDFDPVDFREYCNNPENIPDVVKVAEEMSTAIEDAHKDTVVNFLKAIAMADGSVSEEEEALLKEIGEALKVAL